MKESHEDSEGEDFDHIAADQLLRMGKRKFGQQEVSYPEEADSGLGEPFALQFYQPRLLSVFTAYNAAFSPEHEFDCSGHIMATCLQHFVEFCCWARSSDAIVTWITDATNDNIDLRPRVRNGLVLLFVYAISAAKAAKIPGADMFSVLQDADYGLGIINRTSLRVYNDNLHYFTFLKHCLSGLIVCGLVPENERVNQVRYP